MPYARSRQAPDFCKNPIEMARLMRFLIATSLFGSITCNTGCGDGAKGSGGVAPVPSEEGVPAQEGQHEVPLLLDGQVRSAGGAYFVSPKWIQGPVVGEDCTAEITFMDGERQAPKSVQVTNAFPFMSIHSHDSGKLRPSVTAMDEGKPGRFRLERILFLISGPWELNLKATVNGREDISVFEFEVP